MIGRMSDLLKDKSIVIIGGTSGIGLSTASYLIDQGANVLINGLETSESIPSSASLVIGDARDEKTVDRSIETCVAHFGKLDGLIHVAGGSGRKWGDGPLHDLTSEGWEETLKLNLTTVFYSNRAAIRQFLKSGSGGALVNLSSVLATYPSADYFYTHAYAAAKSAIIGFSRSIAAYYAPQNIRVNVVAPALTDTPMAQRAVGREDIRSFIRTKQPLDGGRVGFQSDLHGAIGYFLGDASRFTTGQVLYVDGGWSLSEGQRTKDS